ncbi:MAG: hypothetical protein IKN63_02820 [Bacilli bacterium]|nr:hypothetical protein [Bacilli bacterium]
MRESVGGTVLFFVILGFLSLLIIFIAMIMNYASAYRTSNYVVNIIEQTEGRVDYNNSDESLVRYLEKNKYYNRLDVTCSEIEDQNASVFHVTTYIYFEVPMLGLNLEIPIKNDTNAIYNVRCSDESVKACNGSC